MGGKGSKDKDGSSATQESKQQETFTTVEPASVLINVYEPQNPSILGGVYHSGLQVYDTEHMFASGSSSLSGIHSHRPKQVEDPQWRYRETVNLGPTTLSREDVRNLLSEMKSSGDWAGNSYSLTGKSTLKLYSTLRPLLASCMSLMNVIKLNSSLPVRALPHGGALLMQSFPHAETSSLSLDEVLRNYMYVEADDATHSASPFRLQSLRPRAQ